LRKKRLRIPQWAYLGVYPIAKSLRWSLKIREARKA
jgi:chlorite dismutase